MPLVPEALGIAAAVPYPPRETPIPAPLPPEALVAGADPAPQRAGSATKSEAVALAALSDTTETAARSARKASPPPAPSMRASRPAETVPVALEAAIAAALVEVGVPPEENATRSRTPGPRPVRRRIAVPAGPPVDILAAASEPPVPAARPVAWSRR